MGEEVAMGAMVTGGSETEPLATLATLAMAGLLVPVVKEAPGAMAVAVSHLTEPE